MSAVWLKPRAPEAAGGRGVRAPPVRRLLAGLVAIAVVPSALLAAALVGYGYDRSRSQAYDAAMTTTRLIASRVDRRLTELQPGLQALASSPALERGDLAAFREHARQFVQVNASAVNVTLVDPAGVQIVNTARPAGAGPVPGHPKIAALVHGSGELAVTGLFKGPLLGEALVAVAVPARVSGRLAYAVGAGIRPRMLDAVLEPLPAGWTVVVLDPEGRIVSRRPWRDEYLGQPATPELAAAVQVAASGTLASKTKEGTPVLAAFSRATQSGYTVAIGVPEQELLAPVRRGAVAAGAVILAVLLVSLLLAGRIASRIARSVGYLSESARDVRKGHVAGAPRMGFREAEEVRLGINIGAAELQHLQAELGEMRDPQRQVEVAAAAIELAGNPMVLVNAQGVVVAANGTARRTFGIGAAPPALRLEELFVADDGAHGGALPGTAVMADGATRRAVLRSIQLPMTDADVSCLAIDLAAAG